MRPLDLFDLGAPSFSTFSVRDGLPESVVELVRTDADGFVWLAAPGGVGRYDGRRWTMQPDLAPAGGAKDLLLDHAGRLWASFWEGGLAHREGERWVVENQASGLPSDRYRRVVETFDAQGAPELWALSMDGMVLRREGARWRTAFAAADLPAGPVLTLARTHRLGGGDRLWIGTLNDGLWYQQEGTWHRMREAGFDPGQVEHLLVSDHDGTETLWVSTFGFGLWRIDARGVRGFTLASGELPTDELYTLAETPLPNGDRALWVASRSGLLRVYADHVEVFDRRHGLPSNVVRGVTAWRSPGGAEVLWIATEAGVARTVVGAGQWQTASLLGASSSGVFGVLVEPDGRGGERLWIASSADGIGLYDGGRWRQFSRAAGMLPDSDGRVVKRAVDDRGENALWVTLRGGHLLRLAGSRDAPRFEEVAVPWAKLPGQVAMDVVGRRYAGRRELWVGTRLSGVYRLRDGRWTGYTLPHAAGPWRVVSLAEQVDGAGRSWLWASGNSGLARFDGEAWTLLGERDGFGATDLRSLSLLPEADGRQVLWIGTLSHGVARLDVTDPLRPRALDASELPPPPEPNVYGAVRDAAGRVYLCSNVGVQQLVPRPAGGYTARLFSRRDGMVHEECNTNAQFVDAHGRFWTGTLGGLTVFDPAREFVDRDPKPLRLTGIRVDGAPVAAPVRVPPGARELRFDYALLAWQRESESRFRTRLVGFEPEPTEWTAQAFRTFSALPPGNYTFWVEARDDAGNASAPLAIPLAVVPAWWQRLWARAAFVAAGLLAIYAAVALRTRGLRLRQRRLEEQVVARTTELHQANARLLELSYRDELTGLANRRRLLETLEREARDGEQAALVLLDVDHFKRYNDRFGHPAGDEALRAVAEVLRGYASPQVLVSRYGGEEFACLLTKGNLGAARDLAERIRATVAARSVPVPGMEKPSGVTISAGVASARLASTFDAHRLLREADSALYEAKAAGRNRVRG